MHAAQCGAARRQVLVEQQAPAKNGTIAVALGGCSQVAQRADDVIGSQLLQGRVEPRRRIGRVEPLGELELRRRELAAVLGLVDLGHIAARQRVRGIVGDRELELPPALGDVAAVGRRQREPDARQRGFGLERDGLLERRLRGAGVAAAELRESEHDERCAPTRAPASVRASRARWPRAHRRARARARRAASLRSSCRARAPARGRSSRRRPRARLPLARRAISRSTRRRRCRPLRPPRRRLRGRSRGRRARAPARRAARAPWSCRDRGAVQSRGRPAPARRAPSRAAPRRGARRSRRRAPRSATAHDRQAAARRATSGE